MGEFVRKNPWLGLESYKEGEILYGRDDDIRDLSQCVLNDIDTLLYGKSGIGKSSILNAGILPAARRNGYLPVLIRLSHKGNHSYLFQINQAIISAIHSSQKNVLRIEDSTTIDDEYVTAGRSLIKEVVTCVNPEKESLYEYFHRHTFHNVDGERIKLLIIFDQFEEIFTLQEDAQKKKTFFSQLADLLNDIMPDELQQKVDISSDIQEEINVVQEDFANILGNLILGVENNTPEYVSDNDIHFVFTIREDFLPEFEYFSAAIPSLKQNRYGLRPINEEQATQIILRPIPGLVDESVAKLIIEKITGKKEFKIDGVPEIEVDSAVLSLYLNRLYEAKEGNTITKELVEQKGGEIIFDFYNDALSDISDTTVKYLEEKLLNGQGRRDNITVYDAINEGKISEYELDVLCNKKKILRQFFYAGDLRIEYVHDILCSIVKKRIENRKQLAKEQREQEEREKEREKIENEKKIIAHKRLRNRKYTIALSLVAIVLIVFAVVIVSMYLQNKEQRKELGILNNEIRKILPSVIEQQINDGDSYKAGRLLLKLFPDTLYLPEDPTRVSLLRELSGTKSTTLEGHTRAVNVAMFNSDGNWAITGSDDMTVKIWDTMTGNLVSSVSIGSPIVSLAISPDNKRFVVATKDGFIKTFSINQDDVILLDSLAKKDAFARFVTFNPSGSEILACYTDGNLLECKSSDLSNNKMYKLSKKGGTYISFDKSGRRMAIAGTDGTIVIWDAIRFTPIDTLLGHKDWVRSVHFDSNGEYLVSCSDDKTIRLWNLMTQRGSLVGKLSDWGTKSVFSPDGKRIIASSRDGILRIIDINTLSEIPELQIKQQCNLKQFDISPDGKRVITSSSNSVAHIWNCGNQMETSVSMNLSGAVYGVSFLSGTNRVVAASNSGTLGVWDVETGLKIWDVKEIGRVTSLKVSPDGKMIALSVGSKIQLFNSESGDILNLDNAGGHHGWIRNLCFNNTGEILVSVGDDKTVILWDMNTRKVKQKIYGHKSEIYAVDISKDNKKIVTGSVDMTIRQWDIASGKQIGDSIVGHKHVVLNVRYNSNDSLILSSSGDQTACIWKIDGTLVSQLVGASGYLTDAIFGLTEDEVITASADKYVRIWCLKNGKETARLGGHLGGVSRLALSKDGILVSSDQLGGIKVWKIPDLKTTAEELSKTYNIKEEK